MPRWVSPMLYLEGMTQAQAVNDAACNGLQCPCPYKAVGYGKIIALKDHIGQLRLLCGGPNDR